MAPSEFGSFQDEYRSLTGHSSPFVWQSELFGMFLNGEIPEALNLPTGLGKISAHCILLKCVASHRPLRIEPLLTVRRDPIQLSLPASGFAVHAAAPWMVNGAASPRWRHPERASASFSTAQFNPPVRMS